MDEFKSKIGEILLSVPKAKRSVFNNDQIMMRCFFCGDSKKDPNRTRLGFRLNGDDPNAPILYNCFNCGVHGMLTPSVLRMMGVNDLSSIGDLAKFNKNVNKHQKKNLGKYNKTLSHINIPIPMNTENNKDKLIYVCKRLGIRFSVKELLSYRVVFNLSQFIKYNDLKPLIDT